MVTHAGGVDLIMEHAKDCKCNPHESAIQDLVKRQVKFEVCEITLTQRSLKKDQFITEAQSTPSGLVSITMLKKRAMN
jgi:intracellular sulfur oxidation DsrE/DsrF family protein